MPWGKGFLVKRLGELHHLRPEGIGGERQVQHKLLVPPAEAQKVEESVSADLAEVLIAGCDTTARGLDRPLGA
jgi:hypothetical protein